jgi:predicted ArsR family transcriptional regulator
MTDGSSSQWTLLTNHAHALICLDRQADIRLIDLAEQIGVRERSAHRILSQLVAAGYVGRHRRGRRVTYSINRDAPFRRPGIDSGTVGQLLDMINQEPGRPGAAPNRPGAAPKRRRPRAAAA